jgi:predicted NACHT family NTPase
MTDIQSLLKDLYIEPTVNFYSSYEEMDSSRKQVKSPLLVKERAQKGTNEIFAEILSKRRGLVLSEPGYGKTRFLQELKAYAENNDSNAFFIELKLYSKENSLEEFIREQIYIQGNTGFELKNDKSMILCFDGLDEVRQDSFHELVRQLELIAVTYDNILFFISCRLFFYQKFPAFVNINLPCITVEAFDFEQVREYLRSVKEQHGVRLFTDVNVDKIIEDFMEPNWESIILIPRYLEKFVEFYLKDCFRKPSRSDLYDFFVNERLMTEDRKRGTQDGVIVRRLLEQIALIMEIYQKNDLRKDEVITILVLCNISS